MIPPSLSPSRELSSSLSLSGKEKVFLLVKVKSLPAFQSYPPSLPSEPCSATHPLYGLILKSYLPHPHSFSSGYKLTSPTFPQSCSLLYFFPPLNCQFSSEADTGLQHLYHRIHLLYQCSALSSLHITLAPANRQ